MVSAPWRSHLAGIPRKSLWNNASVGSHGGRNGVIATPACDKIEQSSFA